MSITLSQVLASSLNTVLTEDQIEFAMVDAKNLQHQTIIEAVCQEFAIATITYDELKQLIQEKSVQKFENYHQFGHDFCTTTVTAIWLDKRNLFNFLRKNPEYSNEDDSSNYDFSELVNHSQIVDADNCYIYYVSDKEKDLYEFILIS